MYQKLFVPVDGSPLSDRAMASSLTLARQLGAGVVGFVAEPEPPLPSVGSQLRQYQLAVDEHVVRTDTHARELLTRFEAMAADQGVPYTSLHVRAADVDQEIVDQAESSGCDMIVMVTHGRSTLGEWVYGSHTKRVLARSQLPVLVLH
jgi:nucleotide-binding universal stress UspA family protein